MDLRDFGRSFGIIYNLVKCVSARNTPWTNFYLRMTPKLLAQGTTCTLMRRLDETSFLMRKACGKAFSDPRLAIGPFESMLVP